jgi:hypothetical protein
MLLIVVSYVVVGGIMTSAQVVSNTQRDMSLMHEQQLETSISVKEAHWHDCRVGHCSSGTWYCDNYADVFHFWVLNTGDQTVSDLSDINVMLIFPGGTDRPYLYSNGSDTEGAMTYLKVGIYQDISYTQSTATPEDLNINRWDPGEYLMGRIEVANPPDYISVVLPNGVETARQDIQQANIICSI